MDYKQQMRELSNIVNKYIAAFTDIQTCEYDFCKGGQLFAFCGNIDQKIFFDIFNKKAPIQKNISQSLFHYKKYEHAYKFIESEYITVSALSNYTDEIKRLHINTDISETKLLISYK